MSICVYCDKEYIKNTEHVFPKGLGGEDIFCGFVCSTCNATFSNLETELIQKSPVSIERSIQGLDGYSKLTGKPGQFKPKFLLHKDPVTGVVYEVGQHGRMNLYLLPQIIHIDQEFYLEGEQQQDFELLNKLFVTWKQSNFCLVSGNIANGHVESYFQIEDSGSDFSSVRIENKIKVKNEIRIDLIREDDELYENLKPRLYVDRRNPKKPLLRIRSKKEGEAIDFILDLLSFTRNGRRLTSYQDKNFDEPIINVGMEFDMHKLERTIVKIGLNCVLYYFDKKIKSSNGVQEAINFVVKGERGIAVNWDKHNSLVDSVPNSHNVFFYQFEQTLNIRISLFNGSFAFGFVINDMQVMNPNEYSRLIIEYNSRANKFQNLNDFLTEQIPDVINKEKQP